MADSFGVTGISNSWLAASAVGAGNRVLSVADCSERIWNSCEVFDAFLRKLGTVASHAKGARGSGADIRVYPDESDLGVAILEPRTLRFPETRNEQLCSVPFVVGSDAFDELIISSV